MTPRSLFLIVLKALGIFFLKDILMAIPQVFSIFLFFSSPQSVTEGWWTLFSTLLLFGIYFLVIYYLLFRTEWIIRAFRLAEGFDEETFPFHIHRSSVLSVVIMVTALLVIINAIPTFCRYLFSYFQEKRLTFGLTHPDLSKVIVPLVELLIGILMLSFQKLIVNFIERKRRTTAISQSNSEPEKIEFDA